MNLVKKGALALGLAASTLAASAAPAQAHDGYYDRGGSGGDEAAIAIGAGIIGLALGAAIASDHGDRGPYYRERGYYAYPRYNRGGYYYNAPAWRGDYRYRDDDRYRHYREWRGYDRDGWRRRGW